MSLDNDFSDLLQAFSEAGVEYIIASTTSRPPTWRATI